MTSQEALTILSLSEPFGPNELRRAFRQKALLYHPDRNPSHEAAMLFAQAVEAYEFLVTHFSSEVILPSQLQVENLEDIFDDIFGYSEENRILGAKDPNQIEVTLCEYVFGYHRLVGLKAYARCSECHGSGSQKNGKSQLCTYCFGGGRIRVDGDQDRLCPKCSGLGRLIEHHCRFCQGFGRLPEDRRVMLDLKPGFKLDSFISHSISDDKKKGRLDLFLKPVLKNSTFFIIEKDQLVCHFLAPDHLAVTGYQADLPTLWGWMNVTIPSCGAKQQIVYIDQAGLPINHNFSDRSVLQLNVVYGTPKQSKKALKQMFEEIKCQNPYYHSIKQKTWWQKILGV